jgi:hypothetical protein
VKITTDSGAWLPVSVTTPVNFVSAAYDKQEGHWDYAPNIMGRTIWVEGVAEVVVKVENIGDHLVKPLTFESGRSFGASGERYGRRIYTHNIIKPPGDGEYGE